KVLCPAMLGYDLYADWAYEGGAFCLQASLGWAMQLAAETARRDGDVEAYTTLYTAARTAPTCDPVTGKSKILDSLAPDSFYHDWLAHPEPDEYWEKLSPRQHIQEVDLPMLHIGGWYDTYLRGTLRCYQEMAHRCQSLQHLWVGPWAHIPWGRQVGQLDFGEAANSTMDDLHIQWFDHFLKGKETPIVTDDPVHLFEMGRNQWRSLPTWPTPEPTTLYFTSTGLASIHQESGTLTAGRSPESTSASLPDTLVHDPWRPVPSIGGHASLPTGPMNRAAVDCRSDVLTYTSSPLTEEWRIAGDLSVYLTCSADAASFDLCTVLSTVSPDGRVMNITEGYQRIASTNGDPSISHHQTYCVSLQPTCVAIPPGQSIRISISAASFPAHPVNSGFAKRDSGENFAEENLLSAKITTLFVWVGNSNLGFLRLPVENANRSEGD
ncbi:MAG: CocE/NonD family hydrolase, partial [Leptolyngbyaceae bacterium]|nr:CocE/NonD family hydrolase [Leptolyngbyaceae bacterium]